MEGSALTGGSPAPAATAPSRAGALRGLRARHPFAAFVAARALALVALLLGITLVTFALATLVPGDPVVANLGERASQDPAIVQQFREQHGLDEPVPAQYLIYLRNLVEGDLGTSIQTARPVATDLRDSVPATVELAVVAMLFALPLGIVLGLVAALNRGHAADAVIRVVSLIGVSVPIFWLGLLVAYWLSFRAGLLPADGRLDATTVPPPRVTGMMTVDALLALRWDTFAEALRHLLLPAGVVALFATGVLTRFSRAAVLEVAGEDYVKLARAKGLPVVQVTRQTLRAALPPIITVAGLTFAEVLSGVVLVETLFSWPGLGTYAFASAISLDRPAIMGVALVVAVIYSVVNFAVDVAHGVVDPRVRIR